MKLFKKRNINYKFSIGEIVRMKIDKREGMIIDQFYLDGINYSMKFPINENIQKSTKASNLYVTKHWIREYEIEKID